MKFLVFDFVQIGGGGSILQDSLFISFVKRDYMRFICLHHDKNQLSELILTHIGSANFCIVGSPSDCISNIIRKNNGPNQSIKSIDLE